MVWDRDPDSFFCPWISSHPSVTTSIWLRFVWPSCTACGILIPPPGIEPGPSAVRAQSPNHWCCPVAQSCPTLCNPMECSTPGFPVLHYLPDFAQTHVHWVGDAIQPSDLCCPLLLLPSVFPIIRVFSSKLVLHIRWPEYWSFNFSISPSNEYSGLISFRID